MTPPENRNDAAHGVSEHHKVIRALVSTTTSASKAAAVDLSPYRTRTSH